MHSYKIVLLAVLLAVAIMSTCLHSLKIGDGTVEIQMDIIRRNLGSRVVAIRFVDALPPSNEPAMFAVTQQGLIWRYMYTKQASLKRKLFLNITHKVAQATSPYDERGLLGFALHHQFTKNGRFYVWYNEAGSTTEVGCSCDPTQVNTVLQLEEYRANVRKISKKPVSLRYLLRYAKPFDKGNSLDNLHVDTSNNKLYVMTGDGGCTDPFRSAQNPDKLFGKMLQLNIVKRWNCSELLTTASFSELQQKCPEAYGNIKLAGQGLRNPGGLRSYVAGNESRLTFVDVGADVGEEVNIIPVPRNGEFRKRPLDFGWNTMEGYSCFNASEQTCQEIPLTYAPPTCYEIPNYRGPLAVGRHDDSRLEPLYAFIGGDVFVTQKSDMKCINNTYLFGEYGGHLYALNPDGGNNTYINVLREAQPSGAITSVAISPITSDVYVGSLVGEKYSIMKLTGVSCP